MPLHYLTTNNFKLPVVQLCLVTNNFASTRQKSETTNNQLVSSWRFFKDISLTTNASEIKISQDDER